MGATPEAFGLIADNLFEIVQEEDKQGWGQNIDLSCSDVVATQHFVMK